VMLRVAVVAGPPAGWTAELEALLCAEGAEVLVLGALPPPAAAVASLVLLDLSLLGDQPQHLLDQARRSFPEALFCLLARYARRPPEARALDWGLWDALYLPAQTEEVRDLLGRAEAFFARRAGAEHPAKVLVVDDEESIREVSATLLEQTGYHVETAADPLEAIGRILQGGFDLVVTDLQMPGMDGVSLLRRIRAAQPQLPVVISTGYATVEATIAALRTGATDFIRKPFSGEDYLQVVARALRYGALTRANVELEGQARAEKSRLRERQYELLILTRAIAEMSRAVNPGQVAECWLRAADQVLDFSCAGFFLAGAAPEMVVMDRGGGCLSPEELVRSLVRHVPVLTAGTGGEELRVRRIEGGGAQPGAGAQTRVHVLGPAARPCAGVAMLHAPGADLTAQQAAFLHSLTVPAAQVLEKLRALAGEERLREEAMVAGMHQGVILADLAGQVLVMNAAARELLGIGAQEPAGSLSRLSAALDLPLDAAVGELLGAGVETLTREFRVHPPRERVLTLDLTLIRGDAREPIAVVGLLRDITELREAERMKSEFVTIVSHELRTPLTTIKNCNSLLLGGGTGAITPEQERFLRMAQVSVDRITRLVNDLLDIAKIESGGIALACAPVDLATLLRAIGHEAEYLLLERRLRLVFEGLDAPLVIDADPERLGQVFFNLLHNAVKFSRDGGAVFVSARACAPSDVPPAVRALLRQGDAPLVEVCVADEGIGIAPGDLERIFERFQQVEPTLRREHGGIGLGLPISRGIVRSHGGELWAAPREPSGSVFHVLLPVGPPPEHATGC